ncbi:uncharacterized protein PV09_08795 [Verruconis gallopava]|uniref:Pre-rRNA-processing protein IPI3 n=1 Tax=Verruconis gallopava TaxID=253628 RepID=A0A0D1ZZN8_9PEZI|nr:uncharacterized protein PV09_08795 [Verruconis gallopava]KIV99489.1 hypothetical protein PV09_08795 [Verruconis gallopava]
MNLANGHSTDLKHISRLPPVKKKIRQKVVVYANIDRMLTERFVAAIQSPTNITVPGSKDAGIFLHELRPLPGLQQTFKRSVSAPNCVAVSETHIFAAQSEKATVHVYNREKGYHEATVPFNEKITCLTLAASGLVLLLGTEGGRVIAWEIATGRLSSTSHAHLQAVTCLTGDASSHFILSGSCDATVLIWSLSELLTFSSSDSSSSRNVLPLHSLSAQRGPITALAMAYGHGPTYIAISASEDRTILVWDCKKGTTLRTYLLRDIPRALVMDRCDRGFYTIYEDGSVQLIDLMRNYDLVNDVYDGDATAPIQPRDSCLWKAEGQELGSGVSLGLSWDGTQLLSGHSSGKIATWDVPRGNFMSVLAVLPGPVSSITMLPITGLELVEKKSSGISILGITKPRIINTETESGTPGNYTMASQLKSSFIATRFRASQPPGKEMLGSLGCALARPSYSSKVLESGQLGHRITSPLSTIAMNGEVQKLMEASTNNDNQQEANELVDLRVRNHTLVEQISHLQNLQRASFVQLRKKTMTIDTLVKDHH